MNKRSWCTLGFVGLLIAAALGIMIYGLVQTVLATATSGANADVGISSARAASWMQAIGAMLGILAAILVPYLQHQMLEKHATIRDEIEVKRLLHSLHTELRRFYYDMDDRVGLYLPQYHQGNAVSRLLSTPSEPFLIYHTMIPKLSMIPDASLRHKIIEAYTVCAKLVETVNLNNELVRRHQVAIRALARNAGTVEVAEMAEAQIAMDNNGDVVRMDMSMMNQLTLALLDVLDPIVR